MIKKEVGPFDLKTSQFSDGVITNLKGPISIQPISSNVCGSPKYSLQVSNDKVNFTNYDPLSTDLDVTDVIQIDYATFPWKYLRLGISSNVGDSGTVLFLICYNNGSNNE